MSLLGLGDIAPDAVADVDDRETPDPVFDALDRRFRFTVDVAAAAHNAKLPRFYSRQQDALDQSWAGERVWCNPPYSNIRPWVAKAWHERTTVNPAQLIVMLLPANRTDQPWWHDLVEAHLRSRRRDFGCEFLPGRICFFRPGQAHIGAGERPLFGCCLLIWGAS